MNANSEYLRQEATSFKSYFISMMHKLSIGFTTDEEQR